MAGASAQLDASRKIMLRVDGGQTKQTAGFSDGEKVRGAFDGKTSGTSSVEMGDWGVRVSESGWALRLHKSISLLLRHTR